MKKLLTTTLLAGVFAITTIAQSAQIYLLPNTNPAPASVSLAWDYPVNEMSRITNFNVYYGVGGSKQYTNVAKAGTNLTFTVTNLVRGTTYYFASTAVDKEGQESDLSNEITFRPNPRPVPPIQRPLNQFGVASLSISGEPFANYMLQDTDLMAGWSDSRKLVTDSFGLLNVGLKDERYPEARFFRVIPR